MLAALKELIRSMLSPMAVPAIYLGVIWTVIRTVFNRAEWGLFVLVALIPLPNVWYKFHAYPLGKDLIDILVFSIIVGIFVNKDGFARSANGFYLIFFVVLNYVALWNTSLRFELPMPVTTDNALLPDLKNYAEMIFLYFLAMNAAQDERTVKTLIVIMAVVILFIGFREFRNFAEGESFSYDKRLEGPFWVVGLGANHLSAFVAEYGGMLLGLLLVDDDRKRRWLYLGAILFGIYSLFFSYSRGGYLAVFAVLTFYALLRKRSLFILLAAIAIYWQTLLPHTVVERIQMTETSEGQIEGSAAHRLDLWAHAMDLFHQYPAFGVGFGGFGVTVPEGELTDTHSFYLRTLSEQGIIGVTAYALLLLMAFVSGWRLYRSESSLFMKGLGLGFMGCIVACVVVNMFGDRWSYFVLGGYLFVAWGLVDRALLLAQRSDVDQAEASA